jgi:lipopolysaccharide transport system ATP-binding protein
MSSSDIAICVENLSKRYILTHQRRSGDGLRHALQDLVAKPFRGLGQRASGGPEGAAHGSPATSEAFYALRDVSFELKRGQVLGIIGRNGAGKSTLLKILSRITEPTDGRVTIEGRVASLLEVGTGFHPDLTGRENIFLNGAILGMTRQEIKARFDEIVAFAEIERFLDTPVKRYSSGMYVRLAFAVSAHLQTDILIVDEVLAVGDAEFQKKCLGKMQEVSSSQGRTVLFVSHQLGAVRRLCNVGCVLTKGTTSGVTSVEEALRTYTSSVVESPFDLNLESMRRSHGLGESAKLLSLSIPPESSLHYSEPLSLIFTVRCLTPLNGITIGIGFDTLDGYRIMTLDSDNTAPPFKLTPGTHLVRFDVERNPLHPGSYSCGAAIMSGTQVLDAVSNCAVWDVQSSLSIDRGFSGCRLPVKVSVTPLSAP